MMREKVIPVAWLFLAAIIIGSSVGFVMRDDVMSPFDGFSVVPAKQCGPVPGYPPPGPCFPYKTPQPSLPPVGAGVGGALP